MLLLQKLADRPAPAFQTQQLMPKTPLKLLGPATHQSRIISPGTENLWIKATTTAAAWVHKCCQTQKQDDSVQRMSNRTNTMKPSSVCRKITDRPKATSFGSKLKGLGFADVNKENSKSFPVFGKTRGNNLRMKLNYYAPNTTFKTDSKTRITQESQKSVLDISQTDAMDLHGTTTAFNPTSVQSLGHDKCVSDVFYRLTANDQCELAMGFAICQS